LKDARRRYLDEDENMFSNISDARTADSVKKKKALQNLKKYAEQSRNKKILSYQSYLNHQKKPISHRQNLLNLNKDHLVENVENNIMGKEDTRSRIIRRRQTQHLPRNPIRQPNFDILRLSDRDREAEFNDAVAREQNQMNLIPYPNLYLNSNNNFSRRAPNRMSTSNISFSSDADSDTISNTLSDDEYENNLPSVSGITDDDDDDFTNNNQYNQYNEYNQHLHFERNNEVTGNAILDKLQIITEQIQKANLFFISYIKKILVS